MIIYLQPLLTNMSVIHTSKFWKMDPNRADDVGGRCLEVGSTATVVVVELLIILLKILDVSWLCFGSCSSFSSTSLAAPPSIASHCPTRVPQSLLDSVLLLCVPNDQNIIKGKLVEIKYQGCKCAPPLSALQHTAPPLRNSSGAESLGRERFVSSRSFFNETTNKV